VFDDLRADELPIACRTTSLVDWQRPDPTHAGGEQLRLLRREGRAEVLTVRHVSSPGVPALQGRTGTRDQ